MKIKFEIPVKVPIQITKLDNYQNNFLNELLSPNYIMLQKVPVLGANKLHDTIIQIHETCHVTYCFLGFIL